MKQYTSREFKKIVELNGFVLDRSKGSHAIYRNASNGKHISIPKNLECVIAHRLIKENNLIIDKKKKMDNYPVGAKDDSRAPYNEPLDVEHERFVSVTLSFYYKVKGHPEMSEEKIKEIVEEYIKSSDFSTVPFDVDELIVLND